MPFTSPIFIAFIFAFLPLFWIIECKSRRVALLFTAIISLAFIAINFPIFAVIPVMQALIILIYQRLASNKSPITLGFAIFFLISPLFIFKYYDFFSDTLGMDRYGFTLPLGISFYTFTAIGFVIDIYRGSYKISKPSFMNNLNLLTFWPHLASGPILRGNHFFTDSGKRLLNRDINTALVLIIFGLYKKIVIADGVGGLVNQNITQGIDSMSSFAAWSSIAAFSIQIYGDFSGYSDMAIGFAILMGIYIPANFNYPYSSVSITDFWRRWHISLSTWIRDYLYIPLGGKRNNLIVGSFVISTVFVLSGLWHGAAWNFILWGAIHAIFLIVERIGRKVGLKLPWFVGWPLTILIISCAWSFFFLDSGDAVTLLYRSVNGATDKIQYNTFAIWFYALLIVADFIIKPYMVSSGRVVATKAGLILSPIILTACFYFAGEQLPFIYFDF